MKIVSWLPLGMSALLAVNPALASGHADEIDPQVVARQSDMKAMAAAAKTISAMFNASVPYDSATFGAAAETIREKSSTTLSNHFTSGPVPGGSHASPEIEADRQRFDALARDLQVYAGALVSAAERHPDAITADMRMKPGDAGAGGPFAKKTDAATAVAAMPAEHAFHTMLQTCTSCHARFRVKAD